MFNTKIPFFLAALMLVGCAKEKEYDTVYKDVDIQKKSSIKTHKTVKNKDGSEVEVPITYMYVPMSLGTPRKVRSAYPFQQGDEKLVRLEWSESGLEVLELEKDDRFSDNDLNDSPVMTIPVEHSDYRCKEDNFGDCTNAEEENDEIEWDKKKYFVPRFEDIAINEVNGLDLFNVSQGGCTNLVDTKVKDYEFSDGVVNVELERTYKLRNDFFCIIMNWINDDFSSNSFRVRFFYSLVDLDKLASPDYEAVDYPIADHDEFGYFTSKESKLSPDYDYQRPQERYFVNRWNPNRENNELVYYYSKNFNKPENKILLDASNKAVEIMNAGLERIGNPFKIVIKQQDDDSPEISPGDLRYNTVVLIEDPLSNGLLGYGPSVKNPLTGEIVQAHVNMYGGVLKAISRRAYDEAVDVSEKQYAETLGDKTVEGIQVAASAFSDLPAPLAADLATISDEEIAKIQAEIDVAAQAEAEASEAASAEVEAQVAGMSLERMNKLLEYRMKSQTGSQKIALAELLQENYGDMNNFEIKAFEYEKEHHGLAKLHKHQPEFFPIGGTTKVVFKELKEIPGILTANGVLKRWNKLNQKHRDAAIDVIISKAWMSTFIHEFGHNLGLRHNFTGSHDRDNFLTDEDLASLQSVGVEAEQRPAYSSIMDYAFSEYNQLSSFGNYDLAAIRFAYKREVEVLSPEARKAQCECQARIRLNPNSKEICSPEVSIMKLEGSVSKFDQSLAKVSEASGEACGTDYQNYERKSYEFCTDENAGLSSTCNRFDEGTSLTEIAKFRAERYENMYKYRNFRDGRLDFSAYDIPSYIFARRYELSQIRDILEEYEFFTGIFSPELMAQGCPEADVLKYPVCGMINDRKEAVEVVGDLLINILKTPDHICAVANPAMPNIVVEYKKLAEIYDDIKFGLNYVPESCFDPAVKENLMSPANPTDKRIVVGETGKYLNGFKDTDPNFKYVTDRAVLGTWPDKIMAMRALFNRNWKNRTTDRAHMALVDIPSIREKTVNVLTHHLLGSPLENPVPFKTEKGASFQIPYHIGTDYKVEQLEDMFGWVKNHLGMHRSGSTNYIQMLMGQTSRRVNYGEEYKEAAFESSNLVSVRNHGKLMPASMRIEGEFSYVDINDSTYYASEDNLVAKFMIDAINTKAVLDSIDKEIVAKVFKQRTSPDAPTGLEPKQAVLFKVPAGFLEQLVSLSQRGAEIPAAEFVRVFGEEDGPLVAAIYADGAPAMIQIVQLKEEIMNNPAEDATEAEKSLFDLPVNVIGAYINGGLSDEVLDYYKSQIVRMPQHRGRRY